MISLMADGIVREPDGLCSPRFRADIVTTNVDYASLHEGDVVEAGGQALRITRVGKRCHPECLVMQAGRTCDLKKNCAFAEPVGEHDAGKNLNA